VVEKGIFIKLSSGYLIILNGKSFDTENVTAVDTNVVKTATISEMKNVELIMIDVALTDDY